MKFLLFIYYFLTLLFASCAIPNPRLNGYTNSSNTTSQRSTKSSNTNTQRYNTKTETETETELILDLKNFKVKDKPVLQTYYNFEYDDNPVDLHTNEKVDADKIIHYSQPKLDSLTIKKNNKKYTYKTYYVNEDKNPELVAYLVTALYYNDIDQWKGLFDNIEKSIIKNPLILNIIAERPNLFSDISGTNTLQEFEQLFQKVKTIILDLKTEGKYNKITDDQINTIKPIFKIVSALQISLCHFWFFDSEFSTIIELRILQDYISDEKDIESIHIAKEHIIWMKSLLKTLKKEKDPSILNKINEEIKRYFNTSSIDELINNLDKILQSSHKKNPYKDIEAHMFFEGLHKINVEVKSIVPDIKSIFEKNIFNLYKNIQNSVTVLNKISLQIPKDKYLIFSMVAKCSHDIYNSIFCKNKNLDKKSKRSLLSQIDTCSNNLAKVYILISILFPKEYYEPRYNFDKTQKSNNPKEINPVIALRKKNITLGYAVLQEIE